MPLGRTMEVCLADCFCRDGTGIETGQGQIHLVDRRHGLMHQVDQAVDRAPAEPLLCHPGLQYGEQEEDICDHGPKGLEDCLSNRP